MSYHFQVSEIDNFEENVNEVMNDSINMPILDIFGTKIDCAFTFDVSNSFKYYHFQAIK